MEEVDANLPGADPGVGGRRKGRLSLWQESALLLALALLLAVVIKSLFLQAFYIPSPSMEPQFIENDRILVQKVSYWGAGSPQRGDIVVFKDPGGWLSDDAVPGATSPLTRIAEKVGLYPSGGRMVKASHRSRRRRC